MSCFIFIAGAWHGGWCYQKVARQLRSLGHEVYCLNLSGQGDRFSELIYINLSTHIKDAIDFIKFEDLKDIVLVGHSYSGLVITGVADEIVDRISALVYIDAFVPKNGESQFDLISQGDRQLLLNLAANYNGYSVPPLNSEMFNFIDDRDRLWVESKLRPHPLACFVEKISLQGNYKKINNLTYIFAENWRNPSPFARFYENSSKNKHWQVYTISEK